MLKIIHFRKEKKIADVVRPVEVSQYRQARLAAVLDSILQRRIAYSSWYHEPRGICRGEL